MAKLHDYYKDEVVKKLMTEFNYNSVMQVPRVEKITLNMGVGEAIADKKLLDNANSGNLYAAYTANASRLNSVIPTISPA